jgi:hypothetical protein
MKKELSTSVYSFDTIINNNCMYVDKTPDIYKLVSKTSGQFFLSRPRRFGKSLTLSTLKCIFSGQKELFKGLDIYDKPYDWKKYPVIHLSMNACSADTKENLDYKLGNFLEDIADDYGLTLKREGSSERFRELIRVLHKNQGKVVILIDEYDKPILDSILNRQEVTKIRTFLKEFYGIIKACEPMLRFTFLTGVSKFSKVSIFSDLNNLTDISMDTNFATLCGFTQEECERDFAEYIAENCQKLNLSQEEYWYKLKENYDGIRFTEKNVHVFNPVSFTSAMMNANFKNYWYETGTPTFLLKLLPENNYDICEMEALELKASSFASFEVEKLNLMALMYQTGYLTIKDYDEKTQIYTLSYPNREVKESFLESLSNYFSCPNVSYDAGSFVSKLASAFGKNDLDRVFEVLNTFYSNINYDIKIKREKYYQTVFYLLFTLLGYHISVESRTNKGRMDAVIKTDTHIYVIEFKLNKTAKAALQQIKDRGYLQKFALDQRQKVMVGVSFDSNKGEIKDWLIDGDQIKSIKHGEKE